MTVFGKPLSRYFEFQKIIMILIVAVGLIRLALSLGGVDDSIVKWVSLTALALIGIIYCAVKVPRTGFGGYRHLLPLYVMQAATANVIIAAGIALGTLSGTPNIYSKPEYAGPMAGNPWLHAGGHLIDGFVIGPALGWLIGAGIMVLVKKLSVLPSEETT